MCYNKYRNRGDCMRKTIVGIFVILVLLGSIGCGKKQEEKIDDDNIYQGNTNEGIIKEQELGNLKFTNTTLVIDEGISKLTVSVLNETDENIDVDMFDILIKDENGNVITTLQGYVGGVVPAHESRDVIVSSLIDLTQATDIEYQVR